MHAFDHDRPLPGVADPAQIGPRHHRLLEHRADVGVGHRSRSASITFGNVIRPPSRRNPASHRGRARNCDTNGSIVHGSAREQFLGAVAHVALPEARDRRVDGHDERAESGGARARDCRQCDVAAAGEIELIPAGAVRCGLHFFHPAAGERRKDVPGAGCLRLVRGNRFAARIEHAAAADRREQEREREPGAEDRDAQVARGRRNGAARPESDRLERAAILAQRDLRIGAAVDVVEHGARQPPSGDPAQIGDVDDPCRVHASAHDSSPSLSDRAFSRPGVAPSAHRRPARRRTRRRPGVR